VARALAEAIDESYAASFEEDLTAYIQEGATAHEAADPFFRTLDDVVLEIDRRAGDSSRAAPIDLYVIEAARASVCAIGEFDNPRSPRWSELFFDFEVAHPGRDHDRYRISAERAQTTVSYEAGWHSVARAISLDLVGSDPAALEAFDQAARKAGHPGLVDEFLREGLMVEAGFDFIVDPFLADLERFAALGADAVMETLALARRPLVRDGRVDDLVRLAEAATEALGNTYEGRAKVEMWLGPALTQLDAHNRFLTRIGTTPAAWEFCIEADLRLALWLERLIALNVADVYFDEFCDQSEEIELLLPSSEDQRLKRIFRREQAIFTLVHGQPDKAATELEELLTEADGEERLELARSLSDTYSRLGRLDEALSCTEEAIALATGPRRDTLPVLRASRARLLATLGRNVEAVQEILGWTRTLHPSLRMLWEEADAWARIVANDAALLADETVARRVETVINRLEEFAACPSDSQTEARALFFGAHLKEAVRQGEAEDEWWRALKNQRQDGAVPYPSTLLMVARYAYARGDIALGRQHLAEVPLAISALFGAVTDVGSASSALGFAAPLLRQIGELLLSADDLSWEDLRLVGELQRDAIPRAQGLRQPALRRTPTWADDVAAARRGLPVDVLARLALPSGRIAAMEWVEGVDNFSSLLTTITASGAVSTTALERPDVDLDRLARWMPSRLARWHCGRPGDPFDASEWQELEGWLVDLLSSVLDSNDHVLFIEHPRMSGIPWHVAARGWTSSYAASWTRMLALSSRPREWPAKTVGLVCVPRFREDPYALGALRRSAERTVAFSKEHGLRLSAATGEQCDHYEFSRIMGDAEVAKLLCHGFVSPIDGEVALMLSHQGALPLANAVASASEAGRRHRLTWRQCQMLPSAPSTIFSGACRTGVSHTAGLGERLGLFGGLFQAGTSTLVAPRWDVVAASVLPTLDDALEQSLTTETSVARALHAACEKAEAREPFWLAWSLALEGDWR
jgi:tetratricopeptide (TPR) repeat protein